MSEADYRHCGTFWPANAGGEHPNVDTILSLPGSGALIFIVADSARYWWSAVKARASLAVWRGLPRPDRLPAHLGWNPQRVAAECVSLWDEASHGGTEWYTPLNELQFLRESGEDWRGYADMAAKLARLRPALRAEFARRGQDVRLLFPAWVPGDDLERADEWLDEALAWDGLRVHAYDNADAVRTRYWRYRNLLIERYGERGRAFPLLVDETNANHTGADERAMVLANAEVCRDDPACLGFCWYIWETRNAGEEDLSIWGNPERLALFRDPPTAAPVPVPEEPPVPDYRQMARDAAVTAGIDPDLFVRQIEAESGFDPDVIACRRASPAGAEGVAQIVRRYHPDVDPCDPEAALAYAANLMAGYLRDYGGDPVPALACYNAGPGATASGLAGTLDGWPYAETVRYVANILQIGQDEARARLSGQGAAEPSEDRLFGPDVPDEVVAQRNSWSCAVRATYAALWAMGAPVTYGDEGPNDVFAWLVPSVDDPSVGLHDASGAGLVAALAEHGYPARNVYPVALADVQAVAGTQPVLLGGVNWGPAGHWVYVRGVEPDGTLILENPAGSYDGIADRLRDSFGRLGPFAMVTIDTVPQQQEGEDPVKIAELEARIAELEAERASLIEGFAHAADVLGDDIAGAVASIQTALNGIRQLRAERVGPRPDEAA